jgi:hypothetical protein
VTRIDRPGHTGVAMLLNTTRLQVILLGFLARTRCIPDDVAKHYLKRELLPRPLRYIMNLGSLMASACPYSCRSCSYTQRCRSAPLRDPLTCSAVVVTAGGLPCIDQASHVVAMEYCSPDIFGNYGVLSKVRGSLSLTSTDNFESIDQ